MVLTQNPSGVTSEMIDGLRAVGWNDEEILMATHIIGMFNYYVRLAEGLGVDPEDFMVGEADGAWPDASDPA